ncbi:MAG: hypothetical protein JSV88_23285 [Candidatus Aminicenantes bacterium]|nr:MAG: hypothetical protein JSV88_23285 [Candidatus Aminicenantes bacterium]
MLNATLFNILRKICFRVIKTGDQVIIYTRTYYAVKELLKFFNPGKSISR